MQNHVAAVSHPGIHQTDIETIKCYKASHVPQYMPHSGISAGVRPLRGRIADGTLSEGSRWSPSVMLVGLLRRPQGRSHDSNLCAATHLRGDLHLRLRIPEGGEI